MDIITADDDSNMVSSLPQAGFSFMTYECSDMAISPSGCVGAVVGQDGNIHFHPAEYIHGWKDAKSDHYHPQAAIVALARETGILVCHSQGTDDILALFPPDIDQGLRRRFVAETLRTVSKSTDYSSEEAAKDKTRIMKDTMLFKLLTLQLCLGYSTDPYHRDIPGRLAWTILNLRSIGTNLASSMSPSMGPPLPEVLISLRGQTKWLFDLMHYILHNLFSIQRELSSSSSPITIANISAQLAGTQSPALHILLHSVPRCLLRFMADITKAYIQRSNAIKANARDAGQRAGLQEIENLLLEHLAFKLPIFDQLLQEIEGLVRKAYAEGGTDARERAHAEQTMMVDGNVPEKLLPVVEALFNQGGLLTKFAERSDGVKIFIAETEWLGLGEETGKEKWRIDVVRKSEMSKGRKVRICRRCGSFTEDAIDGRLAWIMGSQRTCACMGGWVV